MICPIPSLLCAVVREEKVKLETTKIFTAILHLHCISFLFICFTFTEYELVQLFQRWSEDTAIHQLIIIIILIPCQVEKRSWTSQICNLCHLTQEHETEPVAKTKARQLGNFIWINLVPRRRGRQILTIIPDLPDPPSMLCFVISQVLGDTWPAFSRVSLSRSKGWEGEDPGNEVASEYHKFHRTVIRQQTAFMKNDKRQTTGDMKSVWPMLFKGDNIRLIWRGKQKLSPLCLPHNHSNIKNN